MRRKRFWIVALVLALWAPMARPTEAATYTVDTVVDENDGSCSDGDCSLRDAIILANTNSGPDTINFNISGCGGVCTIQPTSALPTLTGGGTTIDGYSQPGAAEATATTPATLLIEVDGTNAGSSSGFYITSAGNVIKGLVINRFSGDGVLINGTGATGNTLSGNYIGTDANGTADLGNTYSGVSIQGDAQNIIGGDTPGERNVISGNEYGVAICNYDVTGNIITQNSIFSNDGWGMGIRVWDGANGDIAAPVIAAITGSGPVDITGTACPGCTVEVFENNDTDGEGETYIGSAIANANGDFTVTVGSQSKPYLTATATDVISGTSEFSAVFPPGGGTYSISGTVDDIEGNPLPGVTVSTDTGTTATTRSDDTYIIEGLPAGTYIITPSKSSYTFSPTSRMVTVPPDASGQDFTATRIYGGLSGRVVKRVLAEGLQMHG